MSRDSLLVELAVLVGLLDLVLGVAQEDMIALLSAEIRFPGRLDAGHAGVVARAVLARMVVDVSLVHLGHVAEEVAAGVDGVVADAAHLALEAGEAVLDLGELVVGLGRDLLDHRDALEADLPAVALVFVHLPADEFGRDVQRRREGEGVEFADVPRVHQDVVSHFVSHENVTVPVVDDAPGGVDDFPHGCVVVRVDLVVVVQDLDGEDFRQEDGRHHSQADEKTGVSGVGRHLRVSGARMSMITSERAHPATREMPKRMALKEKGRVPAPSAQM